MGGGGSTTPHPHEGAWGGDYMGGDGVEEGEAEEE